MMLASTRTKTIMTRFATASALIMLLQQAPFDYVGIAQAQSAHQARTAFANSDYGYCDAKKVASVWSVGIGQAKVVIGNKVLGSLSHLIDADISSTSGRVRCSWEDLQMSYDDALALGNYWNRQPFEAKAKAANLASRSGQEKIA